MSATGVDPRSDAELIASVRSGQISAYGVLYARHVGAARHLAGCLARCRADVDDWVAQAFAKVLTVLRAGRGPDSAFRPYLLTALRRVAYDATRRDRRVELTEDVETAAGWQRVSEPFRDTVQISLERQLAARAFGRLPRRWQKVLRYTEIEGHTPAEVASLFGLSANGVSALALRAREGLRVEYLRVFLTGGEVPPRCQPFVDRLGALHRGQLSRRRAAWVEKHLTGCPGCRLLLDQLRDELHGVQPKAAA
jgi:RNA polymerase sigma factor (sigma-70 family)